MTVIGRWLAAIAGLVATAVLVFLGFGLTPVGAVAWLIPLPACHGARLPGLVAVLTQRVRRLRARHDAQLGLLRAFDDEPLAMGLGISAGFAVVLVLAVWLFRPCCGEAGRWPATGRGARHAEPGAAVPGVVVSPAG